jgi:hypothetical protein
MMAGAEVRAEVVSGLILEWRLRLEAGEMQQWLR